VLARCIYGFWLVALEVCKGGADKIGGHTAEMKALVSSLDFERYTPRTYVYCYGDEMSSRIISELEASSDPSVCCSLVGRSLVSNIRTIRY